MTTITNGSSKRVFAKYISTTMVSSVLSSIYVSIDGIFIGQAVGDNGLTAVNIIWPIEAIATSLARGIGIGGAICMAMMFGKDNKKEGYWYRANAICMLLGVYLLMALVIRNMYPALLLLFGAEPGTEIYRMAEDYTKLYVTGCIFQIFGVGLQPFLRNANKPVLAMVYQVIGCIINIILDYFFVLEFNWEIQGAGLATIIGQGFVCVTVFITFLKDKEDPVSRKQFKLKGKMMLKILRNGITPMGLSLSNSIIIIFYNRACLLYGGVTAAAAYSVINYSYCAATMFVTGAGEGIQPLISFNYGKKDYAAMRGYIEMGKKVIIIIGIAMMAIFMLGRKYVAILFGASAEAISIVMHAVLLSAIVFPLKGMVRLYATSFNAVGKNIPSNLLVYSEALLITPLILALLPRICGIDGIWLSFPIVQGILAVAGGIIARKEPEFNEKVRKK